MTIHQTSPSEQKEFIEQKAPLVLLSELISARPGIGLRDLILRVQHNYQQPTVYVELRNSN